MANYIITTTPVPIPPQIAKKKYTVVYSDTHNRATVTCFQRIETVNLPEALENFGASAVWFVFEGWPELAGDFKIEEACTAKTN